MENNLAMHHVMDVDVDANLCWYFVLHFENYCFCTALHQVIVSSEIILKIDGENLKL